LKQLNNAFANHISCGILELQGFNFHWVNDVQATSPIYQHFLPPYDFFYHDRIIIIPDAIPAPHPYWSAAVDLHQQLITCPGTFIFFAHYQIFKNRVAYITSLTMPEFTILQRDLALHS